MKKVILVFLCLTLAISLCACGGSAQQPPTEPSTEAPTNPPRCLHQFEMSITIEPTCENVGEATYTCSLCNNSFVEELEMTDHAIETANCTTARICSFCGEFFGDALGHDYEDGICTRCGSNDPSN